MEASAQDRLEQARELVRLLEAGEQEQAEEQLNKLTSVRSSELFQEIGKLTRGLHESITNFMPDDRLFELSTTEIPDATERLNHVIRMTEEAANKTLTAVEEALPQCDEVLKQASSLHEKWQGFMGRKLSVEEFRTLSRDLDTYLGDLSGAISGVKGNLNDILMAQDFQDLTGQVIRRVISLVQEVEVSLVGMLTVSATATGSADEKATDLSEEEKRAKAIEAEGPQLAGLKAADTVSSQDEVDDLLSSLGF